MAQSDNLTLPVRMLVAGTSGCIADFATYPLDTAKVRLQVQGESAKVAANLAQNTQGNVAVLQQRAAGQFRYRGMLGTMITISKEEGFRCLYNGLAAGLQRQMCFASVRIGFYDGVKAFYTQLLNNPTRGSALDVSVRCFAGITTGGMAVLLAQPTDVVKVRLQAQMTGGPSRYVGTWHAYRTIASVEGMPGLWKGLIPNVGRNAIVNVGEIVCYDLVKEFILTKKLMEDNVPCHFTSAVVAGFCATVVASPIDVIKTRYMNAPNGQYRGAFDCAVKTAMKEGPSAFYKGFLPSFSRLVSWNICMWITYEQLKRLAARALSD